MAAVLLSVYVERGCGLDVHQQTVVAGKAGPNKGRNGIRT